MDWIKETIVNIAFDFVEFILPVTAITILVTIYCLFVVAVGVKIVLWIVPELLN